MFDSFQEDPNWKKVKMVQRTLTTSTGWYNGIAIKRYLAKKIFTLKGEVLTNKAISSGRFSAYCHYSAIVAFKNLLAKHEIGQGKKVLVHPLTPAEFVKNIIKTGAQVVSIDIDKTTLQSRPESIIEYIEKNKDIDLVVFFGFNGIYEPISKTVKLLNDLSVQSLVFIDNPNLNYSLLDLFDNLSLGSILWDFGDSFVDDTLNEVLKTPLQTKRWFVSWFIESRTRSLLEYHLSESQEAYKIILEAYYTLLLEEVKKTGFKSKLVGWGVGKAMSFDRVFRDKKNAAKAIQENYLKALNSAIPDIFFSLHETEDATKDERQRANILTQSSLLQEKSKWFYDYFSSQVETRPQGTMEIPSLHLKKTYLEYFFYSTEQGYWKQTLTEKSLRYRNPIRLFADFKDREDLLNANFVSQFLISIKLADALTRSVNLNNSF